MDASQARTSYPIRFTKSYKRQDAVLNHFRPALKEEDQQYEKEDQEKEEVFIHLFYVCNLLLLLSPFTRK